MGNEGGESTGEYQAEIGLDLHLFDCCRIVGERKFSEWILDEHEGEVKVECTWS
jgi:hypothetical protein